MVSRSYLQRNEWPTGFGGFPYGVGTVLGFSLTRMSSPGVVCVMLLQNLSSKRQNTSVLFIVCVLPEWCLAYMCVSIETAFMY